TPEAFARLDALGDRLRTKANAVFKDAGERTQMTGDGSLFRLIMTDRPIRSYRDAREGASSVARLNQIHLNLLDEGHIISNAGLGCLSTPMIEADVDSFVEGLRRAVAKLFRPD